MPRRRKVKLTRIALPASELEGKILNLLRGLKECAKLKGAEFVYVGSLGQEPNWLVRPLPSRIRKLADEHSLPRSLSCVRSSTSYFHQPSFELTSACTPL